MSVGVWCVVCGLDYFIVGGYGRWFKNLVVVDELNFIYYVVDDVDMIGYDVEMVIYLKIDCFGV